VGRIWFSKLAAAARDTRGILAIAWRMDAPLTFLYYTTAFVAALAPIASGLGFARLIDHALAPWQATVPVIVVIAVATHIAVVALDAAIRHGLHKLYHDHVFRYRPQDVLACQSCVTLPRRYFPHLEDPEARALINKVRFAHQWRVPDLFRMLACASIATTRIIAMATVIAIAPHGAWMAAAIIAGTLPRVIARIKLGEIRWSIYGSGAPEARKRWHLSELLSEVSARRALEVFRNAPSLRARYRAIQPRIFALRQRPRGGHRRVSAIAPLAEGALVFSLACALLADATAGALSVGSFALFAIMLHQLATQVAEAGGALGIAYHHLQYIRLWKELMALGDRPSSWSRISSRTAADDG
jgi:hypothetical protein